MLRRLFCALLLVALPLPLTAGGGYDLPPLPPPHEYGTLLMDRGSSAGGAKPVLFSHWLHRLTASCRICHGELGFEMTRGATPVSEADNRAGRYCGACHDGGISFALDGNCPRCHTGDKGSEREKFALFNQKPFPPSDFGNGIDWVKAFRRGLVAPAGYIYTPGSAMVSTVTVTFQPRLGGISPAIFPHEAHGDWMDCSACHPFPFDLAQKGKLGITKSKILRGEYCGICHLNVAFPMQDCPRCHPNMGDTPQVRSPRR